MAPISMLHHAISLAVNQTFESTISEPNPDSGNPRTTAENWILVAVLTAIMVGVIVLGAVIEIFMARVFGNTSSGVANVTSPRRKKLSEENPRNFHDEERNTQKAFAYKADESGSSQERHYSLQNKKSEDHVGRPLSAPSAGNSIEES